MGEHRLRGEPRRAFLRWVTGIGGGAVTLIAALPVLACIAPSVASRQGQKRHNREAIIGHGGTVMGAISVACYKPKPGCEEALRDLVRNHLPPLRAQNLVTERAPIVMRTADGTIVEIFEWVSQEAIAGAHKNPMVLDLWKRFEAVCSYETPSKLAEFQNMFAHFEPI